MTNRNPSKPFPIVPEALLAELNERFPEQTPDEGWTDREIWIRVGQRRIVRFLNSVFAKQNENILTRGEE